jgi:hypothetical protein
MSDDWVVALDLSYKSLFTAVYDEFTRRDLSDPVPYLNSVLGPMLEEKLRPMINNQVNSTEFESVVAEFALNGQTYTGHCLKNDSTMAYKVFYFTLQTCVCQWNF